MSESSNRDTRQEHGNRSSRQRPMHRRFRPADENGDTQIDQDLLAQLEQEEPLSLAEELDKAAERVRRIGAAIAKDDARDRNIHIAELQRIAVDPEHRRSGLASALLQSVVAAAVAGGADRLLLEVREGNDGAIAFYAAREFSEIDRRRRYYRDGSTAVTALDYLHTLYRQTFHHGFELLGAGRQAFLLAEATGKTRSVDDVKPTVFVPSHAPAGHSRHVARPLWRRRSTRGWSFG